MTTKMNIHCLATQTAIVWTKATTRGSRKIGAQNVTITTVVATMDCVMKSNIMAATIAETMEN
jgi:hypothetical protein